MICRPRRPWRARRSAGVSGSLTTTASPYRLAKAATGASQSSAGGSCGRSHTGTSSPCARNIPANLVPAPWAKSLMRWLGGPASISTPPPSGDPALATAMQRLELTPREIEVLRLIAGGHTAKEAARKLEIAPKTADNHIQNLYSKIGVTTRAAAALYALERGLVQHATSAA